MRIAVGLPQIGEDVDAVLRAAREAEEAGAWGVWVFDNLAPIRRPDRPALEGWSLLPLLARATARVALVSLVTRAGLRPPALVARMAAVVQAASGGRLVVGLGAGDAASRAEERRFGVEGPTRGERLRLLEETARRLREDGEPVRPRVPPPGVWVGGRSEELALLAARVGDAWHGWGLPPEVFARRARRLRALGVGACWWGGMFDPGTGARTVAELGAAGADGITWMIPSAREATDRPALLEVVRSVGGAP